MRNEKQPWRPLLAALAAVALLTGAAPAQKISLDVAGHGQTQEDAERDALERARDWIVGLLREREPGVVRVPSVDEVRAAGFTQRLTHEPAFPSERLGPHHRLTLTVEVSEADLQRMLRKDRVQQRQLGAARVLVVVVLLLAVFAAFFRLEDATRGYSSGPLKAALVVAISAIAAVVWWQW